MNTRKSKTKLLGENKIKTILKIKKTRLKEICVENSIVQWIVPEAQRKITLSSGKMGESLEVYSPDGQLELQLVWTSGGASLKIAVAKLDICTTGEISMNCDSFNVSALQGISMKSSGTVSINSGEIRAKTNKSIHLDGEKIRLNSPEGEDK